MAFNKVTAYEADKNFLESEVGLVLKTAQAQKSDATLDSATGRYLLKAGTALGTNIVFETVDMTDDAKRPVSVMVAGRVKSGYLPPATVSAIANNKAIVVVETAAFASNTAE